MTTAPHAVPHVDDLFKDWFLDYASYVITDRAIPASFDGLKPVQRRILHALNELDDGRFHKVAGIVGNTMRYHPHGDASIYAAMVAMGQKGLLLDTQGNWGDALTGDPAAAARYIEVRLSKFAKETLFNADLTQWQDSYDGRNREPIALPVKFPMILATGIEGIAVGLSTKIMPHNFGELIEASIAHLKKESFTLLPDFPSPCQADFSDYRDGVRGGKIRCRIPIAIVDKRTLHIASVPYGLTTTSLIDSMLKANDHNKINISQIEDNTAAEVSILIYLPKGSEPEVVIQQLYAFTECEVTIHPLCCVIRDQRPVFCTINELIKDSAEQTRSLLKRQLEIKRDDLLEKWHHKTLEAIFIEKEIYEDIKTCKTDETIYSAITKGLTPFFNRLKRAVTSEDLVRLTDLKIKRISRHDSDQAKQELAIVEDAIADTKRNLKNITAYTVHYCQRIYKKFHGDRPRKTIITSFASVNVKAVAIADRKVYMNTKGFVGTAVKDGELVGTFSSVDEILVIRKNTILTVIKIPEKTFVGDDILYIDRYIRDEDSIIFNLIYVDGTNKQSYVKRFRQPAVVRERQYPLGIDDKSEIIYLSTDDQYIAHVKLYPQNVRKTDLYVDFREFLIKGRNAQGNLLSKHRIKSVKGKSALQMHHSKPGQGGELKWNAEKRLLGTDIEGETLVTLETGELFAILFNEGLLHVYPPLKRLEVPQAFYHIGKHSLKSCYHLIYFDKKRRFSLSKRFILNHKDQVEFDVTGNRDVTLQYLGRTETACSHTVAIEYYPLPSIRKVIELKDLNQLNSEKDFDAAARKFTTHPVRRVFVPDADVNHETLEALLLPPPSSEELAALVATGPTIAYYWNRVENNAGTAISPAGAICLGDVDQEGQVLLIQKNLTAVYRPVCGQIDIPKETILIVPYDTMTIVNLVYRHGDSGITYYKRFSMEVLANDKAFSVGPEHPNNEVLFLKTGTHCIAQVALLPKPGLRNLSLELIIHETPIKGMRTLGNKVSNKEVERVT